MAKHGFPVHKEEMGSVCNVIGRRLDGDRLLLEVATGKRWQAIEVTWAMCCSGRAPAKAVKSVVLR